MRPDIPYLSEVKRQLLEQYVRGDVGRHAPEPLISGRPPGAPALTERRQQLVRLRELSLEDYPQIVALESQYGLGSLSYDQWSHVWLNNPAYRELRNNWPIGWVLEDEKKQIVGSQGNIPLWYEFRRKRIIAASGRATVVDAPYRGYALWLLTAFFGQQNAELCFDTTANYEAARDNEALGAPRVPVGAWDRNVFWITNYQGFLSSWLKGKMPEKMQPLVQPWCYPLAAALFLKDTPARSALRTLPSGSVVECCTAFDDRFDEFWEDLRSENTDLLLAVRNREVLQWHFAYALLRHRLWIWTITQDSRMAAYAIFLKTEDPKSGAKRVSLVDFQALRGNAALLLPMLSAALEECRSERVHVLQNVGLAFDKSSINKLAPYRGRGSWWRYFYKARDEDLAEMLSNPGVWAPSLYDGDASIL